MGKRNRPGKSTRSMHALVELRRRATALHNEFLEYLDQINDNGEPFYHYGQDIPVRSIYEMDELVPEVYRDDLEEKNLLLRELFNELRPDPFPKFGIYPDFHSPWVGSNFQKAMNGIDANFCLFFDAAEKELKKFRTQTPRLSPEEKERCRAAFTNVKYLGKNWPINTNAELHLLVTYLYRNNIRESPGMRGPELVNFLGLSTDIKKIGRHGGKPNKLFGTVIRHKEPGKAKKLGSSFWLCPAAEPLPNKLSGKKRISE